MATRLTGQQIDIWLRTIGNELRSLPELARAWNNPEVPQDERDRDRTAFCHEWDDRVTRFEQLAAVYDAQVMVLDEVERFHELVVLLRNMLPLLRRLQCREPRGLLLDRLSATITAARERALQYPLSGSSS